MSERLTDEQIARLAAGAPPDGEWEASEIITALAQRVQQLEFELFVQDNELVVRRTAIANLHDVIAEKDRALSRIADSTTITGGRAIGGNAQLPGCEEFYRAYNGGIDTQFKKTQEIAQKALGVIAPATGPA